MLDSTWGWMEFVILIVHKNRHITGDNSHLIGMTGLTGSIRTKSETDEYGGVSIRNILFRT